MPTDAKASIRGKVKRMWNKVPPYMIAHFRGEMSEIDEKKGFWILVFTASERQQKKMPDGKSWASQVWIWNMATEIWESKNVFGTLGDDNNKNSWFDHYFYEYEYQRLIVMGEGFHCVGVYSFQGELIGEYELTYPEKLARIFWKMPDKDTLYIIMNPAKRIEKIDLINHTKHRYSFTEPITVKDIVVYPHEVKENLHIMVIESVYDYKEMLHILFCTYTTTKTEGSENSYRPAHNCICFKSEYQIWQPKKFFGDHISKLKWDSRQFDIPGVDILPFELFEKK